MEKYSYKLIINNNSKKYLYKLIINNNNKKYLCKLTINDSGKKYLCKSITNNGGLMEEEILAYIKFTHTTKLNNTWIGTWTSF